MLSDQPQGGFITRKPTDDVLVADDNGGYNDNGGGYNRQTDNIFGLFFGGNQNPQPQPSVTRRRGGGQYTPPPVQRGFW